MYKSKNREVSYRKASAKIFRAAMLIMMCLHLPLNAATLDIYGLGHLSLDRVDDGENATLHIASSSSRLGFKGLHSIDDNVNIIYQYETGVDLTGQGNNDGNGSSSANEGQLFTRARPSFIGLQGDYGQIILGHTPGLDQWVNDQNYFADQIGDLGNFWENGVVGGRLDNVIQYTSPTRGGFEAVLSYAPSEADTNDDVLIVKTNYTSHKLALGLAYAAAGTGTGTNDDARIIALTAGYDFGVFTLGAAYQIAVDIAGISDNDRDDFSLGFGIPMFKSGQLKAQFASSSGEAENSDASMFAIGYDHRLDDDTTLYVAYAMTDNDSNATFSVNGKGHGDAVGVMPGNDPSAISLGIISAFEFGL